MKAEGAKDHSPFLEEEGFSPPSNTAFGEVSVRVIISRD